MALGEVTDDQLIQTTALNLPDIRKILFKLNNYSIAQCTSTRDKDSGWFIFRWKLQPDQVEGFIQTQKKRILKILKTRLEYEERNEFYSCHMPDCRRMTFDEAMDYVFRCPTCKKAVEHDDNSKMIHVLTNKIDQLENGKTS